MLHLEESSSSFDLSTLRDVETDGSVMVIGRLGLALYSRADCGAARNAYRQLIGAHTRVQDLRST